MNARSRTTTTAAAAAAVTTTTHGYFEHQNNSLRIYKNNHVAYLVNAVTFSTLTHQTKTGQKPLYV